MGIEEIRVLDHGHVRLIDSMGGDLATSRSARVSYDAPGREEDVGLINYLLSNGHNTPFESTCVTFDVKAPIFVFRQWHRHRTQSYNELSARYRELPEEYYIPELKLITVQSKDNKQMRTDELHPDAEWWRKASDANMAATFELYHEAIKRGIPRELARVPLPVGAYSHMFATANLFNWMRFCKERQHEHAQYEIRVYADAIAALLKTIAPVAMKAFREKFSN